MNSIYDIVYTMIGHCIMILELVGVLILMDGAFHALYNYIKKDPDTRLKFYHAMAMALEFKLGGEILRTVVVREFSEIMITGAIIVLRAAMTFLIHWAIKKEETAEHYVPQPKKPPKEQQKNTIRKIYENSSIPEHQ